LGRAYPGHRIAILNEDGSLAHSEQIGEISIHRNDLHGAADPGVPLRYWRTTDTSETNPDMNGWWRTGEMGRIDAEGFFWHTGRKNRLPVKSKTTQPAVATVSAGPSASVASITPVATNAPTTILATTTPTE
jgi:acyl-CoA synthetase (AMP-forming)/AMP-acid ligase II